MQASRLRWHAGTSVGYDARKLRVWADGLASGTLHNTHCPFGRAKTSHLNSFRADNSPPAGPFSAELRSDNVALCAIPLPHCHGDCCPAQKTPAPARSCPRRVAIIAPACRHPSRQLRRSASDEEVWSGRLPPMLASAARTPTHPPMLGPLPSPRGPSPGHRHARQLALSSHARPAKRCARRLARHALPRAFVLRTLPRPRPRAMSSIARPAFTLRFCLR